MNDFTFAVIYVTVTSDEEAELISETLLNERKVACVNIVPTVNSRFRWRGRVEKEQERLLIMKTRMSLVNDVIDSVKKKHSYEVPEIIALPIVAGNKDYLNWIHDETTG